MAARWVNVISIERNILAKISIELTFRLAAKQKETLKDALASHKPISVKRKSFTLCYMGVFLIPRHNNFLRARTYQTAEFMFSCPQ